MIDSDAELARARALVAGARERVMGVTSPDVRLRYTIGNRSLIRGRCRANELLSSSIRSCAGRRIAAGLDRCPRLGAQGWRMPCKHYVVIATPVAPAPIAVRF